MSNTLTFTTKDICSALKIAKHQLRNWNEKLHPFANADFSNNRLSRRFTWYFSQ